jgi:hypothetical protein
MIMFSAISSENTGSLELQERFLADKKQLAFMPIHGNNPRFPFQLRNRLPSISDQLGRIPQNNPSLLSHFQTKKHMSSLL